MTTKEDGDHGEDLATHYLLSQNIELLARNFRNGRRGEIDIIARDQELLLFIEVKSFEKRSMARPATAVTPQKQEKIKDAANTFLFRNKLRAVPCRFDVIEISTYKGSMSSINWIKDAFR